MESLQDGATVSYERNGSLSAVVRSWPVSQAIALLMSTDVFCRRRSTGPTAVFVFSMVIVMLSTDGAGSNCNPSRNSDSQCLGKWTSRTSCKEVTRICWPSIHTFKETFKTAALLQAIHSVCENRWPVFPNDSRRTDNGIRRIERSQQFAVY